MTNETRIVFISADGHAAARMAEYREYLDPEWRSDFDNFMVLYEKYGARSFDPESDFFMDRSTLDAWSDGMIVTGRVDGFSDVKRRMQEMEGEGCVAEIIFPDFGLPWEACTPSLAKLRNVPDRTPEQIMVGARAHNRWAREFVAQEPERLKALAAMSFHDIDFALSEIKLAKEGGMGGVVLPHFTTDIPLYHESYAPIWALLEELELPVHAHIGQSSTGAINSSLEQLDTPLASAPINQYFWPARQILTQVIWGGVLERHPKLKMVFTELGSGWTIQLLDALEYSYEKSWLSREIRQHLPLTPKEYFERQCYLGSSMLSYDEVAARHRIGLEKMMIGIDYPHTEGTWNCTSSDHGDEPCLGGTREYLQATLGACEVPIEEARLMMGRTAADLYGFDYQRLTALAEEKGIGWSAEEILVQPSRDRYLRGDVKRPLYAP